MLIAILLAILDPQPKQPMTDSEATTHIQNYLAIVSGGEDVFFAGAVNHDVIVRYNGTGSADTLLDLDNGVAGAISRDHYRIDEAFLEWYGLDGTRTGIHSVTWDRLSAYRTGEISASQLLGF